MKHDLKVVSIGGQYFQAFLPFEPFLIVELKVVHALLIYFDYLFDLLNHRC